MKFEKKDLIAVLAVLFVAALFVGGYFSVRPSDEMEEIEEVQYADPFIQTYGKQPIGDSVEISRVMLGAEGYVAIHEDVDGVPGNIIGTSETMSGEQTSLVIALDRETKPGEILWGVIYLADGSVLDSVETSTMVPFTIANE